MAATLASQAELSIIAFFYVASQGVKRNLGGGLQQTQQGFRRTPLRAFSIKNRQLNVQDAQGVVDKLFGKE